jgi:hypothetical protein
VDDDESSLHETPAEFMNAIATLTGRCDGQSVIREAAGYAVSCSCGWRTTAESNVSGLQMACAHTGDD